MTPKRARYIPSGFLAVAKAAWGREYDVRGREPDPFERLGSLAVVTIANPLLQRPDPWRCWDSYDEIEARARAAFESSATTVVMRIDSPGGDAAGCFELARSLRAMARASGKRLVTYVDGMCASAAYAIGCAADEIVAPPTSSVGSIGVFEPIVDATEADKRWGVTWTFVASGKRKLDGNPHVATTDDAIAAVQAKVDTLASMFFDLVGEMRATTPAGVRALEGELLLAAQAQESGLIDDQSVWSALVERLESSTENPMPPKTQATKPQAKATDDEWKALRTLEKMLSKMTGGDSDGDGDGDKPAAEGDGGESDEDKKKKADEEAKAKAAEDEKAKALAANGVEMAKQIAELNAKIAARDAADAQAKTEARRNALFAKRPDLTDTQRKALAAIPIEQAEALVETWPRVAADPQAAAHAMTPGVTGGERVDSFDPGLTAEQRSILARVQGAPAAAATSVQEGASFSVPIYDPAAIEARFAARTANKEKV